MDAEYCKEKIVKLHDEVVLLKATVKSQRTCIRIYRVLALVGWVAFVAALFVGV